ncbi:hypothetical protein OG763_02405 [Streptomyces sp. NBC_01230]|uniref:hypothetical protein n=1 Tax=Streptomyces sp. NBC_01230 TaxID=2903784 RepID=UPI002E166C5C|nr:hypothetical protein OG763_02405 [Streptomyces sp. NBC_01230]
MAGSGFDEPATFSLTGASALTDGVVRTTDTKSWGTGNFDDFVDGTSVYDAAGT